MRWKIDDEARMAELAIIISYPTSANGIIVLLKTPTRYRQFFPTLFVKKKKKKNDYQLVFNYEQTRTVTILGEHNSSYQERIRGTEKASLIHTLFHR